MYVHLSVLGLPPKWLFFAGAGIAPFFNRNFENICLNSM